MLLSGPLINSLVTDLHQQNGLNNPSLPLLNRYLIRNYRNFSFRDTPSSPIKHCDLSSGLNMRSRGWFNILGDDEFILFLWRCRDDAWKSPCMVQRVWSPLWVQSYQQISYFLGQYFIGAPASAKITSIYFWWSLNSQMYKIPLHHLHFSSALNIEGESLLNFICSSFSFSFLLDFLVNPF